MWEIRTIGADDVELFRSRISRGFGEDVDGDEGAHDRFNAIFEYDRTFAVFDEDDIVGTGAAFSLDLTIPGGAQVPMGGTTVITVQPTHRRRGILRDLMSVHLDEVAEHGDLVAGLWASEGGIYGRFGFGPASFRYQTKVRGASIADRNPPTEGTVRLLDADAADPIVRSLFEKVVGTRPGMLGRSDAWWTKRVLADVESWRGGKSALRFAVHFEGVTPTGYATYRQKADWGDVTADGTVAVREVIATTTEAHAGLWSYLINIDLFPNVEYWNLPIDDPLPGIVRDSRRVRRTISDALWIRVIDVSSALSARRYETDGVVVLDITDEGRPANSGIYRLEVVDGSATCERGSGPVDLKLDIEVLGQLYLGGGNAMTMAPAGKLVGDPEAVVKLHRLFRTAAAPWCSQVF